MKKALLALLLTGCGNIEASNISGTWRYAWEAGTVTWHGQATLVATDAGVTGSLGYPDEDPAAVYSDPSMRDWSWELSGADLAIVATPGGAYAGYLPWRFVLAPVGEGYVGPGYVSDMLKGGIALE
jgi:hypothetical protein